MDTLRAFIAVDIGDDIRHELDELQRKLKKVHANVRWTRPQGIHLTLTFLGDVPFDGLDRIKSAIDRACEGEASFEIAAAGTGTFGKPKHPRVIWAGIEKCPPLIALQHKIEETLLAAGIDFDRRASFAPHLTLGRVKSIDHHTMPLLDKLEKAKDAELGRTRITEVHLIRSALTPRGAEYEVLCRVKLMKDSASSEPGG